MQVYEERRKESLRTLQDTEGRRQRINELVSSCKLCVVSARQQLLQLLLLLVLLRLRCAHSLT